MRWLFLLAVITISIGCSTSDDAGVATPDRSPNSITQAAVVPETPLAPEEPKYPGVTIDETFHVARHISLIDDNGREDEDHVEVGGYTLGIKSYVPQSLVRNGRARFTFKKRQPEGYWGTLVGLSHLRGRENTEIYVAVSGPGGVCCTNYSIVDISSGTPRGLFHSEDFGSFRSPMEIFDADGDGVYELVQFDSCMRYFMDDCGSCSPEPRAHFKYDKVRRQYVPAPGIQQDFVRKAMSSTEKWIGDEFEKWRSTGDLGTRLDLDRSLRGHVADLLHIGKEQRAWMMLEKYSDRRDLSQVRAEIRKRLTDCKFYQALRKRAGKR
jgi:hypothetical protein